jgi:lysophospholipase
MTKGNAVQESDYPDIMQNQIRIFWETREDGFLSGKSGKNLYWVSLTHPQHSKAIIVSNGRVESALKYQELFYQLFNLGYDIYSFDHRGQGLSDRLTEDREIGHVDQFRYYVEDMSTVIEFFNIGRYENRYLVAHSMGAAIATRYLQTYPIQLFDAAVLSAPMFGVNLPPLLKLIAPYWACFLSYLVPKPFYLTKNKSYKVKPFEINLLTSSEVRYKWFKELYEVMPQLKIGGPSARWVWQNLTNAQKCIRDAQHINIPLLVLQASDDVIVSNSAQNEFMSNLNNHRSRLEVFEESRHEVLFETDAIRDAVLESIHQFLGLNSNNLQS